MDHLSCCPLLLVVSSADRVSAEQRLSCPGTAARNSSGNYWLQVLISAGGQVSIAVI